MKTQNERFYITVPVKLRNEMKQIASSSRLSMQKIAAQYVREIVANSWQPDFNEGVTQVIADLNPDEATRLRKIANARNVTIAGYIRAHYERFGVSVDVKKANL